MLLNLRSKKGKIAIILIASTIIIASVMALTFTGPGPGPPLPQAMQQAERGSSNIDQAPERGSSKMIQLGPENKTTGNLTTGQSAVPGNSSVYIR